MVQAGPQPEFQKAYPGFSRLVLVIGFLDSPSDLHFHYSIAELISISPKFEDTNSFQNTSYYICVSKIQLQYDISPILLISPKHDIAKILTTMNVRPIPLTIPIL